MDGPCYICGELTEWECERCEQLVCEDCITPITIHNQMDYCQCVECTDTLEMERADEYQKDLEYEELINDVGMFGYIILKELEKQLKK